MKPLAESKTRLGGHLNDDERVELSAAMLESVLAVLQDSKVTATVVIGGDERVRAIASKSGACWKRDRFMDLNKAVGDAFEHVWGSGQMAAYVPGDLPLLTVSDVDDMVDFASRDGALTICPAPDGGTNALVIPACHEFQTQLGNESYRRHRELAGSKGAELREFWSPGFELDVDTIDDVRRCIDRLPSLMGRLTRVRRELHK